VGEPAQDTPGLERLVIRALRQCFDPEIPVNIYDLGLIYKLAVDPSGKVDILMTLTAPNCPVAGSLPALVKSRVSAVEGVAGVEVALTFDPPWHRGMMSEGARLSLGLDPEDQPSTLVRFKP
jgi:FeS assembly SUF system protein